MRKQLASVMLRCGGQASHFGFDFFASQQQHNRLLVRSRNLLGLRQG